MLLQHAVFQPHHPVQLAGEVDIVGCDQGGDADDGDALAAGAEQAAAEPPPARRVPSAFASAPADHFPNGSGAPAGPASAAAVR